MVHPGANAAAGEIGGNALNHGAVAENYIRRHRHGHAHGLAALLALRRDRRGNPQNGHIEQRPQHVDRNNSPLIAAIDLRRPVDKAEPRRHRPRGKLHCSGNRAQHAEEIECQQQQERPGNARVEEWLFHHAALGGHVVASPPRADHCQQRGQKNVRRQHRLVDLVPERVPVLALDARGGQVRQHQVGQRIRHNRRPESGDAGHAEDQVDERRGQEDEPRQRKQEMRHRVEVAQPLRRLQAARQQRVLDAQNLHHASRPADALPHMRAQPLGCQSRRLWNVDVCGVPAAHLHAQRSVRILGHGLHRQAAHLVQRAPPQHGARAAEAGRVPEIVPILNHAVEELVLARGPVELVQIPLERVGRIEMMRRLQHCQLRVAQHPAHGHLQKAARRHVVAVEQRDKRRIQLLQRVIDVSCLGIAVVLPRDVSDARLFGERPELLPPAVVEDVDMQLVRRPVDVHRGQRRAASHAERLRVGGNQQIHRRPVVRVVRKRHWRAPQRPQHLHIAEGQHHKGKALRQQQQTDEDRVQQAPVRCRVAQERNHGGDAPKAVAERRIRRQQHQCQRHQVRPGPVVHPYGDGQREQRKEVLVLPAHRERSRKAEEQNAARKD